MPGKKRKYAKFDEIWRERLLAAEPAASSAAWRLAAVLIAEADFYQEIQVTDFITAEARLTRWQKYRALETLERLGLIRIIRPGSGQALVAVPLLLARSSRRPRRRR